MNIEINQEEIQLLSSLKKGIVKIKVYKSGLYPAVVTFVLANNKNITLRASEKGIAPRFEVFPITVSEELVNHEPEMEVNGAGFLNGCDVSLLQKAEWEVPANEADKNQMIGNTKGAMKQSEGRSSEIPKTAIHHVTLHAGIEIKDKLNNSFFVATSMFPFSLYVSNCNFSETIDPDIYEYLPLR